MKKTMLIDATHKEETRVAVVADGRLEEFDYESSFRKPLKGNIYLAKVTRVEPSLQAAFVNYGGNRHGFLPFSEIHPDYFRIPVSDREALMAEQEEALREHDELEEAEDSHVDPSEDDGDDESEETVETVDDDKDEVEELGGDLGLGSDDDEDEADDEVSGNTEPEHVHEDGDVNGNSVSSDEDEDEGPNGNTVEGADDQNNRGRGRNNNRGRGGRGGRGRNNNRGGQGGGRGGNAAHRSKRVESFGGDDGTDDNNRFRFNLRRKYKIQEVVKRGQIMLIQVSKEERGNKGAAVTSYLSLPGRYCVLMPNSPRAGGVSRKISNYKDRAKMRDMMKDLEVPKGMSVILRTAGVTRTKTEVKRDLDYLMKLWNNIRELTLESSAPSLVYEEADLVKRAVRDHYSRDIDEVHVAGELGFKTAKDFMKMMIPSHAKKVIEYTDTGLPLFNKFKVEGQIAEIGETTVTLKSGGYLIINPTEALVSVDVNSGRATKERHIEETALKTNLEAAEEVARQLRLRDLGGLIVIDFIDMEDRRNNGKVERKMRDALSGDKARIQMGRISSFGLMEMSRQRMSASLGETQFETCKSCDGSGRTRTADAASILVLRDIEAEGGKKRAAELMVHVSTEVAIYILNNKRHNLASLEERHGFRIVLRADDSLGASGSRVEVSKPLGKDDDDEIEGDEKPVASSSHSNSNSKSEESSDEDDDGNRKPSRRRGRRGGRRRNNNDENRDQHADQGSDQGKDQKDSGSGSKDDAPQKDESSKDEKQPKGGGRKPASKAADKSSDEPSEPKSEESPKPARKAAAAKKADAKDDKKEDTDAKDKKPASKAKKAPAKAVKASNDDAEAKKEAAAAKEYEVVNEPPKSKKKGWWNK